MGAFKICILNIIVITSFQFQDGSFDIPISSYSGFYQLSTEWSEIQTIQLSTYYKENAEFILDLSNPYLMGWDSEYITNNFKFEITETESKPFEVSVYENSTYQDVLLDVFEYDINSSFFYFSVHNQTKKNFNEIMSSNVSVSDDYPFSGIFGISDMINTSSLMGSFTKENNLEEILSIHIYMYNITNYNGSKMSIGKMNEDYIKDRSIPYIYNQSQNLNNSSFSPPFLPLKQVCIDGKSLNASEAQNNFIYFDISDIGLYYPDSLSNFFSNFTNITFVIEEDVNKNQLNITFTYDQLTFDSVTYINKSSNTAYSKNTQQNWVMGLLPLSYYTLVLDYNNHQLKVIESNKNLEDYRVFFGCCIACFSIVSICIIVTIFLFIGKARKEKNYTQNQNNQTKLITRRESQNELSSSENPSIVAFGGQNQNKILIKKQY